MKYKKGDKNIYNEPFDGLSYYPTTGEIYHTNRSKAKFHKFYLEALAGRSSPRILDIGCFIGTELFMLPKPNTKAAYWGIDISPSTINYARSLARQRGEKEIIFQVGDGNRTLNFPDKYFDIIYALELVEHINDPAKFIKEVYRILRDDGVFIISTPNAGTFLNKISSALPSRVMRHLNSSREADFRRHGRTTHIDSSVWDRDAHVSLWNYSRWKNMFKTNGFVIEKTEGSSFFGGSRFISERPFLLGLVVLLDSFIDLLPLKPNLQMCMVLKLKKEISL